MRDTTLGPCCICERTDKSVRNILSLHQKSPMPGRGWGCVVCGLPSDGAVAVVCDKCLSLMQAKPPRAELKFACKGYPGSDGRVPIAELQGNHDHDMSKHPESVEKN